MKKQQSTENNYRTFNRNVQLLISEEFAEREIPANDSVRLLEKMVEEMDLRSLFGAYKRRGRKVANNPATMLTKIQKIIEHIWKKSVKMEVTKQP